MKRCLVALFSTTALTLVCLVSIVRPQMVSIPGGTFVMGSTGNEDEQPVHTVTISPFQMLAREVSVADYDSCVNRGVCAPAHYDDSSCFIWSFSGIRRVRLPADFKAANLPVVCVTWNQARTYCRFLGMDLPTEAQWEFAALALSNNTYAWGNSQPGTKTTVSAASRTPAAVGSFPPNSFGLYDMTGNVWEWTRDYYEKEYYRYSQQQDPQGAEVSRYRSIRGGGWLSPAPLMRIKNRHYFVPESGEMSIGFRCVK
ncbi:MAG: formylglycine-generating enzyme family protein [Chitinivibrionales bacterium]|nr:formylglycine-generating enzyme family protein [Chitinivibrionales bacterium]